MPGPTISVGNNTRKPPRGVFEKVKGSGVWWIHWYDHHGRRHREKVGPKDKAILLYQRRKTDSLIYHKLPELGRRHSVTFTELADEALAYCRLHNPRSFATYSWRMGKLLAHFGARPAEAIAPADVESYMAGLAAAGRKPATVNRHRSLLSLVFRLAVDSSRLASNPVRRVRRLLETNVRNRFLSIEEERRLRRVMRKRFPHRIPELDIALNTGLRRSEQYALEWRDVDFAQRIITVRRSKPGDARHVRLNSEAYAAFRTLKRRAGNSPVESRVFDIKSPRMWFEAAVRAAGLSDFHWHDLRHTVGSRATMAGAPIRAVQELLGHKTLAMTTRYSHLSPDYQRGVVAKLSRYGRRVKRGQGSGHQTATKGNRGRRALPVTR